MTFCPLWLRSLVVSFGVLIASLGVVPQAKAAGLSTTTSLSFPASSVSTGTDVTLTASVKDQMGQTVSAGTVMFYDGKTTIGSAQLVNNPSAGFTVGTATLKARLGVGSHTLKAVFGATNNNQTSTSSPQTVTVTGQMATSASISAAGTAGNYVLTGTVITAGRASATGTVSFNDQTSGNAQAGSASLPATGGTPGFQAVVGQALPSPAIMAVADFNNDGIPDAVVSTFDGSNPNAYISTYAIYLGNGDGSYTALPPIVSGTAGIYPTGVGDFNGDGNLDLATGVNGGTQIYLGRGDGTFSSGAHVVGGGTTVADFNQDGFLDLLDYSNQSSGAAFIVFPGKGDGTFGDGIPFNESQSVSTLSLVVGDYNGDGIPDLLADLVTVTSGSSQWTVFFGNGDNTFHASTQAVNLSSVAIAADLNGDGISDIVTGGSVATVLLGSQSGTFTQTATLSPINPTTLLTEDFDGDGTPDLIFPGGAVAQVAKGNGDGTFQALTSVIVAGSSSSSPGFVADANGDGVPDLIGLNIAPAGSLGFFPASLVTLVRTTAIASSVSEVSLPGSGRSSSR